MIQGPAAVTGPPSRLSAAISYGKAPKHILGPLEAILCTQFLQEGSAQPGTGGRLRG